METSWSARFVDKQVDRAWLDLRLDLAERFTHALEAVDAEPIDITAPGGETLTAIAEDGYITVFAGDECYTSQNVDEAAHTVYTVLYDDWQVVHPAFLESEVIEAPVADEAPAAPAVPALAHAESREQLQAWVEATFQEGRSEPLRVAAGGRINFSTKGGGRVTVRVRNAARVELSSVVARNVGFKKARQVMAELAESLFGVKFYLVQDTLMMAQIIIANPYAAEQLRNALGTFSNKVDELAGWVPDRVLRSRVKRDREALAKAEEAKKAAEYDQRRLRIERDLARTELDTLKRRLQGVLGEQPSAAPVEGELE